MRGHPLDENCWVESSLVANEIQILEAAFGWRPVMPERWGGRGKKLRRRTGMSDEIEIRGRTNESTVGQEGGPNAAGRRGGHEYIPRSRRVRFLPWPLRRGVQGAPPQDLPRRRRTRKLPGRLVHVGKLCPLPSCPSALLVHSRRTCAGAGGARGQGSQVCMEDEEPLDR